MAFPWLLAMAAAGAIIDIQQTKSQQKLIQMGRELENAAFETNLEAARLEAQQASLAEIKQLRQNVGSQIALSAARGRSTAAGSSASLLQQSYSNFYNDERVRKMNLLARESQLRGANVISGLNSLQAETQLGQQLASRLFSNAPLSSALSGFGKTASASTAGADNSVLSKKATY